jgi:hypothetical protein
MVKVLQVALNKIMHGVIRRKKMLQWNPRKLEMPGMWCLLRELTEVCKNLLKRGFILAAVSKAIRAQGYTQGCPRPRSPYLITVCSRCQIRAAAFYVYPAGFQSCFGLNPPSYFPLLYWECLLCSSSTIISRKHIICVLSFYMGSQIRVCLESQRTLWSWTSEQCWYS